MKTINIYTALLALCISTNAICQRTTPQIAAKTSEIKVLNNNGGTPKGQSQQNQQMMKKIETNLKKYENEMQKKQLADNSSIKKANTKNENLSNLETEKTNNLDNTIKTKNTANQLTASKSESKSISNLDKVSNVKAVENESSSEKSESQLFSKALAVSTKKPKENTNTIVVKIKKTVDCAKLVQWVLIDEKSEILMTKSLDEKETSFFNIKSYKNLNITYDNFSKSQPKYVRLKWDDNQCGNENSSPDRIRYNPVDLWDIDTNDFAN